MPAGLEAYDANGKLTFSTATRTTRWMGRLLLSSSTSGFVDVPVTAGKALVWFAYTAGKATGGVYAVQGYANRLGYNFDIPSGAAATVIYGER